MKFIKYLLKCLIEAITLGTGRSDLVTDDSKMIWIGILCIFIIVLVHCIVYFTIFINKKHPFLYSLLTTLLIIVIFVMLSIGIEVLIKK